MILAFADPLPAAMFSLLISVLQTLRVSVRSRAALQLEILALRHQLQVLQRSRRRRVRLTQADRLLWMWVSRTWTEWRSAIVIVGLKRSSRGTGVRFAASGAGRA